ncbi:hypothetical protein GCM10009854_17790 [Saccharopolyspora halophila]|uniref:HTH merR-type domain-containing protein n=1 Tax=Saccharopolyspora halophila TaxID=405551 RepID=A0ABN3G0K9_9PSEU
MLSIKDFSEMCHLSPQALRFYHAEGLLLPAEVDERTGYRSYTFDQVETAMLVSALRGAGVSVKDVRRALDQPAQAPELLERHVEEVRRLRRAQDEAISDARELVSTGMEVRVEQVPATTVVSKIVAGPPVARDEYDWAGADAALAEATEELTETVESCGGVVAGFPWRTWAAGAPEQQVDSRNPEGPHWLIELPVEANAALAARLPADVELRTFEARDELSLLLPGRTTMVKFATAMSRLLAHPLEAAYPDVGELRQIVRSTHVETAVRLRRLDDA